MRRLVDFLAAGGVEDEDGALLFLGPDERVFGDLDDIGFAGFRRVAGDVDLFGEHGELVDGGGAIEVAGDEQRAAAFFFQAVRELGGGGGFAGAVEAADEDAGGRIEIERGLVAAEQCGELVVEDLDDLLAGFDRLEHVLAEGLFLHLGDEVLGDAEFDVGLQQGDADFAEGVGDVFFRNAAHAAEVAEGLVEAVGE